MQKYIEKVEAVSLPTVVLRGIIPFPSIPMSFELTDEKVASACEDAESGDGLIFLVSQSDLSEDEPTAASLFKVGCAAKIKQTVRLPEGSLKVFATAYCRASVEEYYYEGRRLYAELLCKTIQTENNGGVKGEALIMEIRSSFERFASFLPKIAPEMIAALKSITNPGMLADFIACNVLLNFNDKQAVLEEFDPLKRAELVCLLMEKESRVLSAEMKIHKKVRERLDRNQRDYYLKEQIKVIKEELGENDEEDDEEIVEYNSLIAKASLPDEVREKLLKEVKKLAKMPYTSAESSVMRNYLDLCLELPWGKRARTVLM